MLPRAPMPEPLPERPRARGDCDGGVRPCPWAGCRYHLWAEVSSSGTLRPAFPGLEPWELRETCALDVAEDGEHTLDEVAELLGVTREWIRKSEIAALVKIKAALAAEAAAGGDWARLCRERRAREERRAAIAARAAEREDRRGSEQESTPAPLAVAVTEGGGCRCRTLADMTPAERAEMARLYGPLSAR